MHYLLHRAAPKQCLSAASRHIVTKISSVRLALADVTRPLSRALLLRVATMAASTLALRAPAPPARLRQRRRYRPHACAAAAPRACASAEAAAPVPLPLTARAQIEQAAAAGLGALAAGGGARQRIELLLPVAQRSVDFTLTDAVDYPPSAEEVFRARARVGYRGQPDRVLRPACAIHAATRRWRCRARSRWCRSWPRRPSLSSSRSASATRTRPQAW